MKKNKQTKDTKTKQKKNCTNLCSGKQSGGELGGGGQWSDDTRRQSPVDGKINSYKCKMI